MASDREIEQVRKDTERWRSIVRQLCRHEDDLAPRHLPFLDSLALKQRWLDELTYRQAEWLLDIRDDIQTVTEHRGYSVRSLLKFCYENHLGLDEDNEAWVIELHRSARASLRKHEARRLYQLASELGLMDD